METIAINAPETCSPIFISLGQYCEVAYQIRRFTKNNEAYFFDWLVTPEDSYRSILLDDSEFFKQENWEICDGGIRLRDKSTRLLFQHEFDELNSDNHIIDESKVEDHLPVAFSKFIHLKNKTLNTIKDSKNIFLIRSVKYTSLSDAKKIMNDLKDTFIPINPKVNIVLVSSSIHEEIVDGRYFILKNLKCDTWQ
jgi:hypothetical protein